MGTKIIEENETSFAKNRKQMKPFYKNRKFKVITNEGKLIVNSSRDLIERSAKSGGAKRPSEDQMAMIDSLCIAMDGSPLLNKPLMVMDGTMDH